MTATSGRVAIRPAISGDREAIERLLDERRLPPAGLQAHLGGFVVAREGGSLLGCAGLERYGEVGLLRSVAVAEGAEGHGLGAELVKAVIERARTLRLRQLYLLTMSASGYFPRFGFETIAREALPSSLAASEQLQGACPASAVPMRLTL